MKSSTSKYLIFNLLLFGLAIQCHSQDKKEKNENWKMDMAFAGWKNGFYIPFSGIYKFHFGKNNWFSMGPGLRLTQVMAAMPSTKKSENKNDIGPANVVDQEIKPEINSLTLFNIMYHADARLYKKAGIGANIDLAGLGFDFINITKGSNKFIPYKNLLLGPYVDRGMLVSDLYVYFPISPLSEMRLGISHYSLEYDDYSGKKTAAYGTLLLLGFRFPF
jgi:hypothetical protein